MRLSQQEKYEIIKLVDGSDLGANRTLKELGIYKRTFYNWYKRYHESGYDGLAPKANGRRQTWNKIPTEQRDRVITEALEHEDLSCRELAFHIVDRHKWYISESSVCRILKRAGLITAPAHIVLSAADEFEHKTRRINEMWQTDFTYFKIIGWGWYYLATIMDDYSRYIIIWELCKNMETEDAKRVVGQAIRETGVKTPMRPRLLTDNGSCYISQEFKKFIAEQEMGHVKGAPYHPQTQGKIERYHRTMKNIVKLENYFFPEELRMRLEEFMNYYNNDRYYESLGNLTPADVYFGRDTQRYLERRDIKLRTLKERRKTNRKILA
jgi:putative transposase